MRNGKRHRKKQFKKINTIMKDVWAPFIADMINIKRPLQEMLDDSRQLGGLQPGVQGAGAGEHAEGLLEDAV